MEIYLKRTLNGFIPDGDEAVEELRKIKTGTTVRCEITRPRSLPQMRYYWALCGLVAMNHEDLQTKEQVDQAIRMETGHVELIKVGEVIYKVPARISFTRLEQEKWERFLSRAKDCVIQKLLPGVTMPELEAEIARMAS